MPVEGEEMVETAEVVEDPMLNLFQQNNSLNNDQAITTLFAQQEPQGIMAAKGGLTNYLKENAPKGEFLAYINPDEATMLKKAGGSGKLVNGIPSFEPRSSREADQKSSNTSTSGGGGKANIGDISGPATAPGPTNDPESNREKMRTDQYTTGPKSRTINETITTPRLHRITGDPIKAYTKTKTTFSPNKTKNTWYEAAVKNLNRNIKDVDRKLNPSKFGLVDIVLFLASKGLINSKTKQVADIISNVKIGKRVGSLVSNPTKIKGVKDTLKDIGKNYFKNIVVEKTSLSKTEVNTAIETIQKALDTPLGRSIADKFTSLNTTSKNKEEVNINDEVALASGKKTPTFTGGDNDEPLPNITPVVPELIAEEVIVEEPETSLFSMSNLNRIRDRQNRRWSFFANRGGLAGLFRVKNQ
jgi:hypothetical protein